ncbi:MAG: hypothetical protein HC802_04190 [Caldilineaceae bacterium]|nr:hypothetical protein [Caldilineaceae bacterium]
MAKVIHVDPEDGVERARRLLGQTDGDRIILDLPPGWSGLDNLAKMRLVQRQAQLQKLELALVTRDEVTSGVAKQLGIPVFLDSEEALRRRWRMRPPLPLIDNRDPATGLPEPPPWRSAEIADRLARPTLWQSRQHRIQTEQRYRKPLPFWLRFSGYLLMGGFVVALLSAFSLYVLPAATITLMPGRESLSVTVPLIADPNQPVLDLEERILPARLVETTIEERGVAITTGAQQKPVDLAVGSVTFSNLGTTPVQIASGTVVNTSTGTPVSFRTVAPAELEGGVGAKVTVPIEALEPGVQGNVRANTINTVSGGLRFRVRVSNPNGTFGGGSQLVKTVAQQDKDQLLAETLARVEAKAYEALAAELEPGEWLPPDSVQSFTIAQVFDQFNDDVADELALNLRVLVQGVALENQASNEAMLTLLQQAVPERGKLVADSVTVRREPGATAIGRQVQFTMTINGDYVIPIDPVAVKDAIAGLTPEAARQVVEARWTPGRSPELYRDPEWLNTLPRFPSRIQVRVSYEGALVDNE